MNTICKLLHVNPAASEAGLDNFVQQEDSRHPANMTQRRFNNFTVLHSHKPSTEQLDLTQTANSGLFIVTNFAIILF